MSTCGTTHNKNKLKTGRKIFLQPRLYRKIQVELGRKGGEVIRLGHLALEGDIEEERENMGLEIFCGEWRVQATYRAPQHWGPTPGRWFPLAHLKTRGTYRKPERNWDSTHEECMYIVAYSWKQGRRSRMKLPGAQTSFLCLHHCKPWPAPGVCSSPSCSSTVWQSLPFPRRVHTWKGQSQLGTGTTSKWGKGEPSWHVWRWQIRSCLEVWLAYWDFPAYAPACTWQWLQPLLLQSYFFLGERHHCQEGDECTLRGKRTTIALTLKSWAPAPSTLILLILSP